MFKARFHWKQNTKFPIYNNVIKPYLESKKSLLDKGASLFSNTTEGDLVDIVLYLDIVEDFTFEVKSNFEDYSSAIQQVSGIAGSLLSFAEKMNTLSAMSGRSTNFSEIMKYQIWKDTDSFRMNFKFLLETKTDPFVDVYAPAVMLTSMNILSAVKEGQNTVYYTPGVNTSSMRTLNRDKQSQASNTSLGNSNTSSSINTKNTERPRPELVNALTKTSKLLQSFSIIAKKVDNSLSFNSPADGVKDSSDVPIITIYDAFIETCRPTFSRDRTASGIPVRCELDLSIQSIFSANDSMFGFLSKSSNNSFMDKVTSMASIGGTNIFR